MTKEQEREILKKIVKLIESTEEGSYIRTAFDGCAKDAEDNINDDAAYSWKDRAQSARQECCRLRVDLEAAQHEAQEWKQAAEAWKDAAISANSRADEKEHARHKLEAEYKDKLQKACEAQSALEKAQDEIVRLKARLFDLIDK